LPSAALHALTQALYPAALPNGARRVKQDVTLHDVRVISCGQIYFIYIFEIFIYFVKLCKLVLFCICFAYFDSFSENSNEVMITWQGMLSRINRLSE